MEKGVFSVADVHHQVAIVFKTPKHHQNSVQKTVYIQLYRPSNGKYSEPLKFDYIPDESKFPVSFSDVTNGYGKQSDDLNEILEKPKKRKCAYLDRYEDPNSLEASLSPSMLSNSSSLSPPYDLNKFNLLDLITDLENSSPMIFSDQDFPMDTPIANMNTVPEQTDFYLPSNTDFKSDQLFYNSDIFNECKDYPTLPHYNNFEECATMHPILADGISADGVDKISDRMGSLSLKENTEKKNVISSKKQKCSEDFKAGINKILKNRNISTFLHHYGPNLVSLQDENGNSILHLAILEQPDNLNLIIKMIEMVPENIINQQNNVHETPLHLATKGNHQKILLALLIEGGNPNIQNQEGDNCLHLAARHNFLQCLKMVMIPTKYGKSKKHKITDLNALNYNGMSALHLSIVNESEDCMNFLLKAKADPGVDVNAKDFREYTPLHLACIKKGKSFKTVFAKFNDDKDMIIKFLESLHPDKASESESNDDDEYPNYSTDSDCEPEDKSENETLIEKASDHVNGDIIATQECVQINKNKSNFMKIEEELCEYLDSNDNWKKLAELIGLDIEHVEIFGKGSSAGQTVIKQIKALNDPCDSKVIIELLNIAGLEEGIRILKKDLQSP
ncbi:nuclear factor NF-kappa-B p110 subunit [Caerostris extrusa]|uniref:Nuclear factor NF-kappa-B p110 subunit n=1 Tax=Caerostris extrusa TaxID=172846 RepID=A0AAV4SBB8_CAEEX|nr:nuclear factor NF-kappa-B p110 subunit [Caerostris extrusa]